MRGQIEFDPKILATGKTRRAILRKYGHDFFIESVKYLPYLTGKPRKIVLSLLEAYVQNPHLFLVRGNSSINEDQLEELLKIQYYIKDKVKCDFDPSTLCTLLAKYEQELVIDAHDKERWIILKVQDQIVKEQLENLRAAGINICGSAWGPHISLVRNEKVDTDTWVMAKIKNNLYSPTLEFTLGTLRHNKQGYYWYEVRSLELEEFRTKLGLSPRPTPPFHLTLGKV